jgi:predicted ATP-grasp superfamily ATP-dependent carboligase
MDDVLLVGLSARSLAEAARAAGYGPLAADLFCDLDTHSIAVRSARIAGDLDHGLAWAPLIHALTALADGRSPIGIVCGAGFEDRHEFLDRLADRWPLYGNAGRLVGRVKDPAELSALCRTLGVPHPSWADTPMAPNWLSKKRGGAGGSHIGAGHAAAVANYWQERVPGEAVSALVLGAGKRAMVIGLSSQWTDPLPTAPFRYGGAVRPAELRPDRGRELVDAAERVSEEAGLVGLNSIDFLVGPEAYYLIEVNPRPGATLDIFRPAKGSMFAAHIGGCRGSLPIEKPTFKGAAGACVAYARRAMSCVPEFAWPEWTADRQPPGTSLGAGAPVCTVRAEAETAAEARRLVEERRVAILEALAA